MNRLQIGDRVECGRRTTEAVIGSIAELSEGDFGLCEVVQDDYGKRHVVLTERLSKVRPEDDVVAWSDWPEQSVRPALVPDLIPIHEPEPGLMDEEILPLEDDWFRGPE
ncbi:hypothetical protein [Acetobacter cerevisiae]|uniref:hypothetical protein n=1 Tax=Acetobacter cerevisiae TaxID=178900 RepID=UPI00078480D0|nr:hypothetical protein [Acetobacter cerevisiae]